MNKIILSILILIALTTFFVLGLNFNKNDTFDNVDNAVVTINKVESVIENKKEPHEGDEYDNGIYPGLIKKINIDKDGKVSLAIDFVQFMDQQESFLSIMKNYYNNNLFKNNKNWDSFLAKYHTYKKLEDDVKKMTSEKFDDWYSEMMYLPNNEALLDFPNGLPYIKNGKDKIRTYGLIDRNIIILSDGNTKEGCVENPDICFSVNKLIENSDLMNYYTFQFTLKNGLIEDIKYIWQP